MTLIRYPGSKAKLVRPILDSFPDEFMEPFFLSANTHYVEPFFGSGAVGFELMPMMHRGAAVTIADLDIGIVSLWRSVKEQPKQLIRKILEFKPSVESFYELKAADGTDTNVVDNGLRKLALHRMSVSGFGVMAGGPIGGRGQTGNYTVDCRWKPERMAKCIARLSKLLNKFQRIEILHQSVFETIAELPSGDDATFVYLDPPYYEKGSQLYKFGFSAPEHQMLAAELLNASFGWIASYDDHQEIRRLYSGCRFTELDIVYSNAVCREPTRPKNREVLIAPAA